MDNDYGTAAGFAGLFIGLYFVLIGFFFLVAIAYYVVMAIALSKFFAKVGVDGWIAWVPIYNTWKWLEVGGQPGWLSLLPLAGVPVVTNVFLYVGMWRTGIAFRKDAGFLVLGIFLPFVWAFLLARPQEQYDPALIGAAGYGPPLAGFGSLAHWQAEQARQQYGQPTQQPPSAPAA